MKTEVEKLSNLENDILDRHNEKKISKPEMIKILTWCEKIKNEIKKRNSMYSR